MRLPLWFSRRFSAPDPRYGLGVILSFVALVVVQLWSLIAYLVVMARDRRREAQLEAATRGRITQSTARTTGLAA